MNTNNDGTQPFKVNVQFSHLTVNLHLNLLFLLYMSETHLTPALFNADPTFFRFKSRLTVGRCIYGAFVTCSSPLLASAMPVWI
ncbi:hypothetical protein GALMADRAFT_1212025 [Galerina marginata CBS 339.88]|uniref:Uncharacterized protein n=1 Tax=Galerina marginata (strain CBS 339.88) TaxID=685588 RepID=A0A067SE50_GALM3|nr:hypothetical protein GALMADRAFT_1212025 [Galerina marginata CBS 339.88]